MSLQSRNQDDGATPSRRQLLVRGGMALGGVIVSPCCPLLAQMLAILDVAYAASMGSLMEGPVKRAAATSLKLEVRGRGQGASALGQLIASGSITPDVFMSITATPMQTVFQAGKASHAEPIARTEMVIAYSPKSRFAPRLDAAAKGAEPWWKVLQEPGFRFGRSDPAADPQGRNIIFSMMLAGKLYGQPNLVDKVLGPTVNHQQINMEGSLQSRLQTAELDAAAAYRVQPGAFHLPYISLPAEVNLSGEDVHTKHPEVTLLVGSRTFVPEPLIFYAAVLNEARNSPAASAFVAWLKGPEAQTLFHQNAFDAPGHAAGLHA
jgi:molybdate/tungstate transport system substrate-binding protein